MALTFANTQVADTEWHRPPDYDVYGVATNFPGYVEHGRDFLEGTYTGDQWYRLNNNLQQAVTGTPWGDAQSRFEGRHQAVINGLFESSNNGRQLQTQARIVPRQEPAYVYPYGMVYGLRAPDHLLPPGYQWPPHAVGIEWESTHGVPVAANATYASLKGVGFGYKAEPGGWNVSLKSGAVTLWAASGNGITESAPASGSSNLTASMDPTTGAVTYQTFAHTTLAATQVEDGALVGVYVDGGSYQSWRPVNYPGESGGAGVLTVYTVRPPRWRYIYDYPEPGDGVAVQPAPPPAGTVATHVYGILGGYGDYYPRLMHWTPDAGLVTVDPTVEWGRGTGPMVHCSDGRLFVYDAQPGSVGYTVDETLGDFQSLPIGHPIGTSNEQLPPVYRAGLAYRPETDRLWLSGEVYRDTSWQTYQYSWQELGRDGADLKHVANTRRLPTWYSNQYSDAAYVDGRLYRMSNSNFVERFDPRTGVYDFACFTYGDRPDKIVGGADGLLYALKYAYDPNAGRGGYSLFAYDLAGISFDEAVYNYADYPVEQSLTPVSQWPLEYDYGYYTQDFQLVGSTFYYTTDRLPDQGWEDSDPSRYGVVALDLVAGTSSVLVGYPWLIDPAANFWADGVSSLIVVTGEAAVPSAIAGIPIDNRQRFK